MFYELSYLELHNPLFMQGTNLGTKIFPAQKQAKAYLDDVKQGLWIYFKLKLTFIPMTNVSSADMAEVPEDIKTLFKIEEPKKTLPPALLRAKKEKPSEITSEFLPVTDPNDPLSPEEHRRRVREASMNSFKAPLVAQSDQLIQETRNLAMGIKAHKTAQVSSAKEVGNLTQVTGKPKAISHQAAQAQMAKELKE